MSALLPARRRAERFAAAVDGAVGRTDGHDGPRSDGADPRLDVLLEVVGSLRSAGDPTPGTGTHLVTPRAEYVADLRTRLMAEADTALVPTDRRLVLVRDQQQKTRRPARLSAAAAALVVVAGTAGVSVAAQSSLPGQTLYPVKRGLEQVGGAFSFTEPARGRDLLAQSSSRLDEAEALMSDGDPQRVGSSLDSFTSSAGRGADLLFRAYQSDGDPATVIAVRDFAATSMGRLDALSSSAPESTKPEIDPAIADAARLLSDLDQQARVLCPACGTRAALPTPPALTLTSSPLRELLVPPTAQSRTGAEAAGPTEVSSRGTPGTSGRSDKSSGQTSAGPDLPDIPDVGDGLPSATGGSAPASGLNTTADQPLGGLFGTPGSGPVAGTVKGASGTVKNTTKNLGDTVKKAAQGDVPGTVKGTTKTLDDAVKDTLDALMQPPLGGLGR